MDFNNVKKMYLPPRLPAEYQEVEYIQGTGGPYINTGFATTLTMKIIADASCSGSGDMVLATMPISGSLSSNFSLGRYNGTQAYMSWNGNEIGGGDWSTRKTMTAYQDGDIVYRQLGSDTQSVYRASATLSTPANLWLFTRNNGGSPESNNGNIKLYGCKIYDSNVIQRDFIPCYRKSDNEIGLYDLVNGIFYTNNGTGAFTKGDDVGVSEVVKITIPSRRLPDTYQEVEYIESIGSEGHYIDTGVNLRDYDQNLDIELVAEILNPPVNAANGLCYMDSGGKYWFTFPEVNTNTMYIQCAAGSWSTYTNPTSKSTYKLNSKTGVSSVNNTTSTATSGSFVTSAGDKVDNGSLYIFAGHDWNWNQAVDYMSEKLYSLIIKDATTGTKIRDFVPCYRKADNEIGLYDLVNNVFYTNQGIGRAFLKGDDVSNEIVLWEKPKLVPDE